MNNPSLPEFETIRLTVENNLATIVLNRPDRMNAMSAQMKVDLRDSFRALAKGSIAARALLITGAGRAFCAGADLLESAQKNAGGMGDAGSNLMDDYHPMFLELADLDMPVITAVNGAAAGAGMSLAISADFILAGKSGYFLQAFVNLGLAPDAGSSFLLPRLIGPQRARRMMMLGERIPAQTAFDWGMVYEVCEDDALLETATVFATKLANGPTQAYAGIRGLMRQSYDNSYASQLQEEAFLQRKLSATKDATEGVTAFVQKRPADFKGS